LPPELDPRVDECDLRATLAELQSGPAAECACADDSDPRSGFGEQLASIEQGCGDRNRRSLTDEFTPGDRHAASN